MSMKIKLTCKNCKKEFETQYKHRDKKYCGRSCYFEDARKNKIIGRKKDDSVREERICKVCNKEFTVRKKEKKTMCSDECRLIWGQREDVKQKRLNKIKETTREKYGVNHIWNLKEIHQKTMDNRDMGVITEKQKNTVREKHLKKLLPRLKESKLELLDDYTRNKNGNTSLPYNFKCLECDHQFQSTLLGSGITPKCPKCNPSSKNTNLEIIISEFLTSNNIEHFQNYRKLISPQEVDFYLPKHKLAIEVNGLYWHGETQGKDKNYHLNKKILCNKKGVNLIHISEDELISKKDIVLSMLRNKIGIIDKKVYARKCTIKEINPTIKTHFLNNNHLKGSTRDSVKLGLFNNDGLVSVMTFGKRKITKGKPTWEINRFASLLNTNVVGGFSKLFKHFVKKYSPERIITYADLNWSSYERGNVIYNNMFKYVSHTNPSYYYFNTSDNSNKYHRYNFRKDKLVKEGFNENDTEWGIMRDRGFDRIWDCGNIKFEYEN